ncbi:MAG: hypothetical protein ACRDPM_20245 [Solirubrobacteraceae bacterium]
MRVTLAIYITLFAIALVAVAQILYWRLVIAREVAATDAMADMDCVADLDPVADMDWLREQAQSWAEFEADEMEPALA